MTSLIGVNYALDHTADAGERDKFHQALDPSYSVGMVDDKKDIPKLLEWGKVNKATTLIGRIYHPLDGGFHLKPTGKGDENKEFVASPEDLMNDYTANFTNSLGALDSNSFIYVMNEPNTNTDPVSLDKLSHWTTRWLDVTILKKRKSVMWDFGDRQPIIVNGMWQDWTFGHLKRMALYPNWFLIGMHLYGPDKVTEHLEAYVKTCSYLGITPIPVVATEFGVDTDHGSKVNGYKTQPNWTGSTFSKWVDTTLRGDLLPYLRSGVLKGVCLFGWNNAPQWKAFDFQEDTEFKNAILLVGAGLREIPPLQSSVPPFPLDFEARSKHCYIKAIGTQFVRSTPSFEDKDTHTIITSDGTRCDLILEADLRPEERVMSTLGGVTGVWLPIDVGGRKGFVYAPLVKVEEIKEKTITSEVPVVKNTEPVLLSPVPPVENPIKTFTLQTTFVGTEEECKKALEGINLFLKNAWNIEKVVPLAS